MQLETPLETVEAAAKIAVNKGVMVVFKSRSRKALA